jgi:hypothetical protein
MTSNTNNTNTSAKPSKLPLKIPICIPSLHTCSHTVCVKDRGCLYVYLHDEKSYQDRFKMAIKNKKGARDPIAPFLYYKRRGTEGKRFLTSSMICMISLEHHNCIPVTIYVHTSSSRLPLPTHIRPNGKNRLLVSSCTRAPRALYTQTFP